jgi:3-isopropylmalate dehydrogenase
LPGEGIGPEITAAAVEVLRAVASRAGIEFAIRQGGAIGTAATAACGEPLTSQVVAFCESAFADGGAILCGPGGGRFVYDLRARFDLYCKLIPIRPMPALNDIGALRPAARDGVDLLIVRENTGGCYYGQWSRHTHPDGTAEAHHSFRYRDGEISRVIRVAARLARGRRQRLALVVKPAAMPAVSQLWTELFHQFVGDQDLDTQVLEVDNAGYQIVAAARDFDVVVAPNHFGDILGDVAALLLGSRGVSHSANCGPSGRAVFQTAHGAAWDLTGKGTANPIGMILAAAMMLRESFGMLEAASAIESAIARTLAADVRTADVAAPGSTVVGCLEMGQRIAENLALRPQALSIA